MQINSHANLLASVSYIVYNGTKKLIDMLNIKPISDLRNYIEVLKQVDVSNRVYLTRNGHGEYGILTMAGMIFKTRSRACLKIALCQPCVTVCGRFVPHEGAVAGYSNRIRGKSAAKWGVWVA